MNNITTENLNFKHPFEVDVAVRFAYSKYDSEIIEQANTVLRKGIELFPSASEVRITNL